MKVQFEQRKGRSVPEIDDVNELSDEQRATLWGQAMVRIFTRLSELDTSFKHRLGEPVTERDRDLALLDMIGTLSNEVIALWGAFEQLAHRLGIEIREEGPHD